MRDLECVSLTSRWVLPIARIQNQCVYCVSNYDKIIDYIPTDAVVNQSIE